jgi:hypothetical protein
MQLKAKDVSVVYACAQENGIHTSSLFQEREQKRFLTIPAHRCVVVASKTGDFDGAGRVIDAYISEHGITVDVQGRDYTICERYRYNAEGFARYSLPIISY